MTNHRGAGGALNTIIDRRLRAAGLDPRLALDITIGTVVSVSTAQRKASVRLAGAEQPTAGIDLHAGLGRWPLEGDPCVVLRRPDGLHLLLALLADIPTAEVVPLVSTGGSDDEEDGSSTTAVTVTDADGYQRILLTAPGITDPPEILTAPPDHRLPLYGPPVRINQETT